jgi:hypothetical protein
MRFIRFFLTKGVFLLCFTFQVQANSFFDSVETSSDAKNKADQTESSSENSSEWNYKGFVQQKLKYGLNTPDNAFAFERDEADLSRVQTDAFIEVNKDFSKNISARLGVKGELNLLEWENGKQKWRENNSRLFLKDAFVDLTYYDGHWLRIGNQIFAWGESESLTITDILATTDQREFGQAELRDIREQIPAIMYSLPLVNGKLATVLTIDAGANRYADSDEDFYPYIRFKDTPIELVEKSPEKNWELALRYERQFNAGDISIVTAVVNDNDFTVVANPTNPTQLDLEQFRHSVLGFTANRVVDSFLLSAEMGAYFDYEQSDNGVLFTEDQFRSSLGIEYNGINDWIFSYELNTIQTMSTNSSNVPETDSYGHVFHIQNTALNERITQHLWHFELNEDNGSITRWDIDFEWNDEWILAAAIVLYDNDKENSDSYPFRHQDTVNFSVKYSF